MALFCLDRQHRVLALCAILLWSFFVDIKVVQPNAIWAPPSPTKSDEMGFVHEILVFEATIEPQGSLFVFDCQSLLICQFDPERIEGNCRLFIGWNNGLMPAFLRPAE